MAPYKVTVRLTKWSIQYTVSADIFLNTTFGEFRINNVFRGFEFSSLSLCSLIYFVAVVNSWIYLPNKIHEILYPMKVCKFYNVWILYSTVSEKTNKQHLYCNTEFQGIKMLNRCGMSEYLFFKVVDTYVFAFDMRSWCYSND